MTKHILKREYSIGNRVMHPKWGKGTVIEHSGVGESLKITVHFDNDNQKRLLLTKYAKLKKIKNK